MKMLKREFYKTLRTCVDKKTKLVVPTRVDALDPETKERMSIFLERNRGPILVNLIEPQRRELFAACGYLFTVTSKKQPQYTFLATEENRHLIA